MSIKIKFAPEAKILLCSSITILAIVCGVVAFRTDPCDNPSGYNFYQEESAENLFKGHPTYPDFVSLLGEGCRMRTRSGTLVIVWRKNDGSKGRIRLFLEANELSIKKYNLVRSDSSK